MVESPGCFLFFFHSSVSDSCHTYVEPGTTWDGNGECGAAHSYTSHGAPVAGHVCTWANNKLWIRKTWEVAVASAFWVFFFFAPVLPTHAPTPNERQPPEITTVVGHRALPNLACPETTWGCGSGWGQGSHLFWVHLFWLTHVLTGKLALCLQTRSTFNRISVHCPLLHWLVKCKLSDNFSNPSATLGMPCIIYRELLQHIIITVQPAMNVKHGHNV